MRSPVKQRIFPIILISLIIFVQAAMICACGLGPRPDPNSTDQAVQTPELSQTASDTDSISAETTESVAPEAEIQSDAETGSALQPSSDQPDDFDHFEIHFIDVGQADSTLIICDGEAMLIDGGWPEDSSLLYSYLKIHGIDRLKYVICTHPDLDHAGGLAGALSFAVAENAYSSVLSSDLYAFNSFLDRLVEQNCPLSVPAPGTELTLGSASGEIIGPLTPAEGNNGSLIVRLNYGSTSFLFTGDAEAEEELELTGSRYELTSTLLKVSHHGSNASTIQEFLDAVSPEYAVISCGAANDHGFPADQVLRRLKEAGVQLFRTDMQGDIIVRSDGSILDISTERNSSADTYLTYYELYGSIPSETEAAGTEPFGGETNETESAASDSEPAAYTYILNTRSKLFHYPDCEAVGKMSEWNREEYYGTHNEVIAMGYDPCGMCHP